MVKICCRVCFKNKVKWQCMKCGSFLCDSHVDKKFSAGRLLTKSALTVATGGLGAGAFAVGKGASKDHTCVICKSKDIKRIY